MHTAQMSTHNGTLEAFFLMNDVEDIVVFLASTNVNGTIHICFPAEEMRKSLWRRNLN